MNGDRDAGVSLFYGKAFLLERTSNHERLIWHEDFPMIHPEDMEAFVDFASARKKSCISGCKAPVHPYRLMSIDENGYDQFLADIPQRLRGNRHCYPDVYQIVPALIFIPQRKDISSLKNPREILLYPMPREKLLDLASPMDNLLIRATVAQGED